MPVSWRHDVSNECQALKILAFCVQKKIFWHFEKADENEYEMSLNENKCQRQAKICHPDAPPHQTSDAQPAQRRVRLYVIFSFALLELRLRKPAKPAAPTESGYPQGHRMHKTEPSTGAAWHIERGSGWIYPHAVWNYPHIVHRIIHRKYTKEVARLERIVRWAVPVAVFCCLRYNEDVPICFNQFKFHLNWS